MIIIKSKFLICSVEEVYENYGIVILGEDIIDIIPNNRIKIKYPNEKIIDKTDSIILPGFINTHMHQYGILSRGIPANVQFNNFEGFLWDYWWPLVEDRIKLKQVIATTKASTVELLESGVVGFCDTLEAPFVEKGTLIEQGKVLNSIGVKALLSLESSERVSYENGVECLEENRKFIDWARKNSKILDGAVCTHTLFTCSEGFLKKAKEVSESTNSIWQFHLSESIYEVNHSLKKYEKLPIEYYEEKNLLGGDILASQCVKVSEEEIETIKKRKVKIAHMPISNCEVGGGFSPIPKMLNKELEVGLGTDGYINDFFSVMKWTALIHKAVVEDSSVVSSKEVFKMATENGASILNFKDSGRLKVGNKGDFIVLEDSFKSPVTIDNIFDQIVIHGEKEYVNSVYINGKAIVEEKEFKTIDKEKVKKEVRDIVSEFWKDLK